MGFSSYQEWAHQSQEKTVLEEASSLITEAIMVMRPTNSPDGEGDAPCFISQRKIVELADILFKIEGIQRLHRIASEEGPSEEVQKYETILNALFDLAHMKIDEAQDALFGKTQEEPEVQEPEELQLPEPEQVPEEPVIGPEQEEGRAETDLDTISLI